MGSSEPQFSPNHLINPETGFLESPAFETGFNSDKKVAFLNLIKAGYGPITAMKHLHLKRETVFKHMRQDLVFKDAYKQAESEYIDALESKSRDMALHNDKATIERIFQLKCLLPEKYGQENKPPTTNITINLGGQQLENAIDQAKVLDTETVD